MQTKNSQLLLVCGAHRTELAKAQAMCNDVPGAAEARKERQTDHVIAMAVTMIDTEAELARGIGESFV